MNLAAARFVFQWRVMRKRLTLGSGLRLWLSDNLQERGVLGSLAEVFRQAFFLARDYTPARRRLRYGDLDYDFEHAGVDTTWANIDLRTRLLEIFSRGQYQGSEPQLFHEILQQVTEDVKGFTFIDMGSGKGRALLMASEYPFAKVIGVEIIPELHETTVRNIAKFSGGARRCPDINSWCGDAREFEFPPEPSVVYFFNPFPEDVLRNVLVRLERSVRMHPRKLWVIYHNLVYPQQFDSQNWLEKVTSTHQYAIYRSRT
jgi:SAM-dependent methyltransferase